MPEGAPDGLPGADPWPDITAAVQLAWRVPPADWVRLPPPVPGRRYMVVEVADRVADLVVPWLQGLRYPERQEFVQALEAWLAGQVAGVRELRPCPLCGGGAGSHRPGCAVAAA